MIDERWQERIKQINSGLYIEVKTNEEGYPYYMIMHKDDRTGLVRQVFAILDENGNPCELDFGTLERLQLGIDWEGLGKFREPKDLSAHYIREIKKEKAKKELEQRGFILDRADKLDWSKIKQQYLNSITKEQWKQHQQEQELKNKNKQTKIYL
jgi:hypothetical protein